MPYLKFYEVNVRSCKPIYRHYSQHFQTLFSRGSTQIVNTVSKSHFLSGCEKKFLIIWGLNTVRLRYFL